MDLDPRVGCRDPRSRGAIPDVDGVMPRRGDVRREPRRGCLGRRDRRAPVCSAVGSRERLRRPRSCLAVARAPVVHDRHVRVQVALATGVDARARVPQVAREVLQHGLAVAHILDHLVGVRPLRRPAAQAADVVPAVAGAEKDRRAAQRAGRLRLTARNRLPRGADAPALVFGERLRLGRRWRWLGQKFGERHVVDIALGPCAKQQGEHAGNGISPVRRKVDRFFHPGLGQTGVDKGAWQREIDRRVPPRHPDAVAGGAVRKEPSEPFLGLRGCRPEELCARGVPQVESDPLVAVADGHPGGRVGGARRPDGGGVADQQHGGIRGAGPGCGSHEENQRPADGWANVVHE